MQIFKCLLTVCAAVCVFSVYGGDNEAQIKAREALEKKLNDLQGQPAQAAPAAPAPAPTPAPAPAAKPPVAQPPVQPAAQAAAPAPADPEAIAKARQALEQKMNELHGQPAQVAPVAPAPAPQPVVAQPPPPKRKVKPQPAPAPAPVAAPAAAVVQTPVTPETSGVTPAPAADPEAIAKAREALREKMQSLGGQPATAPAAPAAAPATTLPPGAPAVAVTPVEPPTAPGLNTLPEADPAAINKARDSVRTAMGSLPPEAPASAAKRPGLNFPPLQGPPLGISADKEQKLKSLLQQYKMDLITPEQYQASRAKILAEP